MAYKRRTIKDIAKMAGVSPTAVSFVIHGKNGVSEKTKEKILAVIKETDYYPSAASQRMTLGKSFNIAFIYPTEVSPFSDLFYYEVANGITEELTDNKYNVVFIPLKCDLNSYELPYIIKRQDTDGVILLHETPVSLLDELEQLNIPFILVDWQSADNGRINISLDCEQSIYQAVEHLIKKGHTKIAFWGSDTMPHYYLRCLTGYQNALTSAGLPIYPGWIVNNVDSVNAAVNSLNNLSSLQVRPTAVCCMNDMCAINSIQAAALTGVKVPDDLSFISIDDILIGKHIHPQLTTMSYRKSEIGKVAAQLLLQLIANEKVESTVIKSDKIIERQSVLDLTKSNTLD